MSRYAASTEVSSSRSRDERSVEGRAERHGSWVSSGTDPDYVTNHRCRSNLPLGFVPPGPILVSCEYSGAVSGAFRERGFEVWSCDLLPTEGDPRWHHQGDAIQFAYSRRWWLHIMFPECTFLANSGAKHLYAGMKKENGPNPDRWAMLGAGAFFFLTLWRAPADHKAAENPIMLGHVRRLFPDFPEFTQFVQPWQHGDGETKATGLVLENLPPLIPSNVVEGREPRVWRMGPSEDRRKERARFPRGLSKAMADQWGDYLLSQQQVAA